MSGTMMTTMCQIFGADPVTQLNLKNVLQYYLRCFTDMALHSSGGCYATTRILQQYGRPYQPKNSPSYHQHCRFHFRNNRFFLFNNYIIKNHYQAITDVNKCSCRARCGVFREYIPQGRIYLLFCQITLKTSQEMHSCGERTLE